MKGTGEDAVVELSNASVAVPIMAKGYAHKLIDPLDEESGIEGIARTQNWLVTEGQSPSSQQAAKPKRSYLNCSSGKAVLLSMKRQAYGSRDY